MVGFFQVFWDLERGRDDGGGVGKISYGEKHADKLTGLKFLISLTVFLGVDHKESDGGGGFQFQFHEMLL